MESKLRESTERLQLMQRLIDDQEEEFELRLKSKVVEWKTEWDAVEEELKDEIRKLKNEVRESLFFTEGRSAVTVYEDLFFRREKDLKTWILREKMC